MGEWIYMKFALALSAGVLVSYGSLRLTILLYTRALRWRYGSQRLADVQASFDFVHAAAPVPKAHMRECRACTQVCTGMSMRCLFL